jgi:hypothetical protein
VLRYNPTEDIVVVDMYLSICFFIALSWLFAGAKQGKMKLLLLRYIVAGAKFETD